VRVHEKFAVPVDGHFNNVGQPLNTPDKGRLLAMLTASVGKVGMVCILGAQEQDKPEVCGDNHRFPDPDGTGPAAATMAAP